MSKEKKWKKSHKTVETEMNLNLMSYCEKAIFMTFIFYVSIFPLTCHPDLSYHPFHFIPEPQKPHLRWTLCDRCVFNNLLPLAKIVKESPTCTQTKLQPISLYNLKQIFDHFLCSLLLLFFQFIRFHSMYSIHIDFILMPNV